MNRYNLKTTDSNPEDEDRLEISDVPTKRNIVFWILLISGGVFAVAGIVCLLVSLFGLKVEYSELSFPEIPTSSQLNVTYSKLTGMPLADAALVNAPAYCIQTPNGTDGARPQAGLNQAGVIFEAIAESGITRFAAIYQNPTSAVIGPIRSLRLYYLQWDTPFDCTIVHAGGADDALEAVRSGGYKDLTENYAYMYRGTYGNRLWNNLFTTSSYLKQFSADYGYTTSDVHGFSRMTPDEAKKHRVDSLVNEKLSITKSTTNDLSKLTPKVTNIGIRFGGWSSFNVTYSYNPDTNSYLRSYESGDAHEIYNCPEDDIGKVNPEDNCTLVQLSPSTVVAMIVQESRASDGYHEDITAVGSGTAYIFQNGTAITGSWQKDSVNDQIVFKDSDGKEVKLVPGQTFVSAVPEYGSVDF